MDISVSLGRLALKNPVLVASGTFGFGREPAEFYDLSVLGGIISKSVTLKPQPGHPPPRIAETPGGMLNAIGLANPGIQEFLKSELPFMSQTGTRVIVNIAAESVEEYAALARMLEGRKELDALELNISCPNIAKGGACFAMEPDSAQEVVSAVRKQTSHFLITKLSPNVSDIKPIAAACTSAGTDAISLTNTFLGMAIDWRTRKPLLSNVTGGVSGPAIKPLALRFVYEAHQATSVPIIGIGGIVSAKDVLEFMVAGATAVEIGTGNFIDPLLPKKVIEELPRLLAEGGFERISDLIGTLEA